MTKYIGKLNKIIVNLTICIVAIASTVLISVKAEPISSLMDRRIQSASELIKDIDQFKTKAAQLHADSQIIIAQAERLRGETSKFEIKPPVINGIKMDRTQLESAKQQYNQDVNEFAAHAQAYNQHLKDFQTIVGECHASSQALAAVLQKYELHVSQFHMPIPVIRPPHICGLLQERVGDMSGVAKQMMGDQIRVAEAEAKLQEQEEGLKLANGAVGSLQTKAILTAQRAKGEVQLASEFGRLKEEYDMLKTEKDTIDGAKKTDAQLAQTSVSGQIVKKHGK